MYRRVGRHPDAGSRQRLPDAGGQAEQVRSADGASLRDEREPHLRLPGSGPGNVRRVVQLRLQLVHVLQRVQVRALQDGAQVPPIRQERGGGDRGAHERARHDAEPAVRDGRAASLPEPGAVRAGGARLPAGPQARQAFFRCHLLFGLLRPHPP
uniref:(northern house mosquito) hypothetical protein n=1 Tax=Culex pipiens TaxID=7175 RepID=A0A8D8BN64_CULPI